MSADVQVFKKEGSKAIVFEKLDDGSVLFNVVDEFDARTYDYGSGAKMKKAQFENLRSAVMSAEVRAFFD